MSNISGYKKAADLLTVVTFERDDNSGDLVGQLMANSTNGATYQDWTVRGDTAYVAMTGQLNEAQKGIVTSIKGSVTTETQTDWLGRKTKATAAAQATAGNDISQTAMPQYE